LTEKPNSLHNTYHIYLACTLCLRHACLHQTLGVVGSLKGERSSGRSQGRTIAVLGSGTRERGLGWSRGRTIRVFMVGHKGRRCREVTRYGN
jgi:hypothetical protein